MKHMYLCIFNSNLYCARFNNRTVKYIIIRWSHGKKEKSLVRAPVNYVIQWFQQSALNTKHACFLRISSVKRGKLLPKLSYDSNTVTDCKIK